MSSLDALITRSRIAYFSMEIALRPEMHTYSGGLGVLAGDTARSCAELRLPVVFVSLASRAGYFRQVIDDEGRQHEEPDHWDPAAWCAPLHALVAVDIEGRQVWIRGWLHELHMSVGGAVPVLLLDTDLEQNHPDDRALTAQLYGGDEAYRLKQEIVLGIGGLRMLRAAGFEIDTYHLNEGHAALLTLELLKRHRYHAAAVRDRCVFTTHTPVEAGHDRFQYALFESCLPGYIETERLKPLAGDERLNLTRLALNLSGFVNGVARRHAETTAKLFPGFRVHAITNGVHVGTWAHKAFAALYREAIPQWQHEPELLVRVLQLPEESIWHAHLAARADLRAQVERLTGDRLDPELPVVAFARRMTGYKRPLLLFSDLDRLAAIAERHPFQLVLAGKAHPRDSEGKAAIQDIHRAARRLRGRLNCVFLPNYDMEVAKGLVAGADVWLNTPLPPMEASGTSGMKAALNGGLNLSVLDGWWIEACIEGVTGWSIGQDGAPEDHAAALYGKLERTVLPLYYRDHERWRWMMKQAIAHIGYYFNSQRMMRRYASEAYLR